MAPRLSALVGGSCLPHDPLFPPFFPPLGLNSLGGRGDSIGQTLAPCSSDKHFAH